MIQTLVSKPHWSLAHFVCQYSIKEFDCLGDTHVLPMCANNQINLTFFINCDTPTFYSSAVCCKADQVNLDGYPGCLYCGLLTSYLGSMVFKGHIKMLSIYFKPTGFYGLFGISPAQITDRLAAAVELLSAPVLKLQEQMQQAKTNAEIFKLADAYLQAHLHAIQNVDAALCLIKVTELLSSRTGMLSVSQLAYTANMSLKTFERKFIEQVGVYPKLYSRIRRFTAAFKFKTDHPNASWTMICFLCGYYDQNHFIKEFIEFAGMSPLNFFKVFPVPEENVLSFNDRVLIEDN
ncbi:MAG: AraC family transcriptional regulator [Pedobacter sp.]|jgi:AraC-like DNA-binding protein|nr:AraC family transcriptional regulator [Pedobacter sp.]